MKIALALALTAFAAGAQAQYYNPQPVNNGYYNTPKPAPAPNYGYTAPDRQVNGYVKQDGTYVQPYHATTPDYTKQNNYSTQGNYNPYTGQNGYKKP